MSLGRILNPEDIKAWDKTPGAISTNVRRNNTIYVTAENRQEIEDILRRNGIFYTVTTTADIIQIKTFVGHNYASSQVRKQLVDQFIDSCKNLVDDFLAGKKFVGHREDLKQHLESLYRSDYMKDLREALAELDRPLLDELAERYEGEKIKV